MKIPFWRSLGILIVVYFGSIALRISSPTLFAILSLLFWALIIYGVYGLVKKGFANASGPTTTQPGRVNAGQSQPAGSTGKSNVLKVTIVATLILIVVFRNYLSAFSINTFYFTDRLLYTAGTGFNPVAAWSILGIFVGVIYGALVAWKKYRLDFKLVLIPVGVLIILLLVLFLINKPLADGVGFSRPMNAKKTAAAHQLVSVYVSSYMPVNKGVTYYATNLLDRDENTAWIENVYGDGSGQAIGFSFDKDREFMEKHNELACVGFRIRNGYTKTIKLWDAHNRLMGFDVFYNNDFISTATASNFSSSYETINIPAQKIRYGDKIIIKIKTVYRGWKPDNQTAISELVPMVEYEE